MALGGSITAAPIPIIRYDADARIERCWESGMGLDQTRRALKRFGFDLAARQVQAVFARLGG